MRNCLILGSGRSGTSMIGGILHQAGYFVGEKLYREGLDSNPKGFFEWKEINEINEEILSVYGKGLSSFIVKKLFKKNPVSNPGKNQRWLLSIPEKVNITDSSPKTEDRIRVVIKREPFCYKDPRFSYTLPVWKRFLKPKTGFICVFREPDLTVGSILKECSSRDYLADLYINRSIAYKVWANIYSHILVKNRELFKDFFFVHYNQIYDGTSIPFLSDFLDADISGEFVEKELKRNITNYPVPKRAEEIYQRLCELANLEVN